MPRITKRTISGLTPLPKAELFIWDSDLRGFGVRVMPSGVAAYLVQYRTIQGKSRRYAFARVGTLTLDEAKDKARRLLAETRDGSDPSADRRQARADMSWAEICAAYMDAARNGNIATARGKPKRASTVAIDEGRVSRHMIPLIGNKVAKSLTRADVQRMYDEIAEGKTAVVVKTKARGKAVVTGGHGTAARVVELLGGIWTWAEKRGLVTGASPARGVDKIKGEPKDRALNAEELSRLGRAIREQVTTRYAAAMALRLIALTGMRREEACALRWNEISFNESCLRLSTTKTGKSLRPIGAATIDLLRQVPPTSEFLFPSRISGKSADLKKQIKAICEAAGLHDVTSHDLRRTFATMGDAEGYSDATVGELLGHAKRGVTNIHYIKRPDAALVEAASRISARIAAALDHETSATVTSIRMINDHGSGYC